MLFRMEAQLALEFEKYEQMERDEVEETWRMEKRLQEREVLFNGIEFFTSG